MLKTHESVVDSGLTRKMRDGIYFINDDIKDIREESKITHELNKQKHSLNENREPQRGWLGRIAKQ